MNKKVENKVEENEEVIVDEKREHLSNFLNAVINKDDEAINASWSAYSTLKSKDILGTATVVERDTSKESMKGEEDDEEDEDDENKSKAFLKNRDKRKAPLKKMKKEMSESILTEFTGSDSRIRLKGDDVLVDGKVVGVIENDLNNADTGITFKSTDGKKSQEFENIKDMYQFLVSEFGIEGEE